MNAGIAPRTPAMLGRTRDCGERIDIFAVESSVLIRKRDKGDIKLKGLRGDNEASPSITYLSDLTNWMVVTSTS